MRSLALVALVTACSDTPEEALDCPAVESGDAGDLAASYAERCNVPSSMGQQHWYRLGATLPGTTHIVQLELWPGRGTFQGKDIAPGTYTIAGDDLDFLTCGVCLRAVADQGGPLEREYFATGGTVTVAAVSSAADAPLEATITDATFAEVTADHTLVEDGCTMEVARVKASGTLVLRGGGGGGGGGGDANCKTTVGN